MCAKNALKTTTAGGYIFTINVEIHYTSAAVAVSAMPNLNENTASDDIWCVCTNGMRKKQEWYRCAHQEIPNYS